MKKLFFTLLILAPMMAFAHQGHGHEDSFLHYMYSHGYIVLVVMAVLAGVYFSRRYLRK